MINKIALVTRLVTAFFFITITTELSAQEYRYEIGGAAGSSFYMGDANRRKPFLHPGMAGGLLLRYNINLHWAVRANLMAGMVSGETKDSGNLFPSGQQASFRRSFAELGPQLEFSFFPYSDQYSYRGTRPYSPYLFIGGGITYATGEKRFLNVNMPFGAGFKYKIKERMNIGIEFSMRKLFGDDFDVTRNMPGWDLERPYNIGSSILKNQDWYSITMIYLTWDFGLSDDPCQGNEP